MSNLCYLATPYSKYPGGRQEAYTLACEKAAQLMLDGHLIFCPIAHSHSIEEEMDTRQEGLFWLDQDFAILKHCDVLMVYQMPGWDTSFGVQAEIDFALYNNIPITMLEYKKQEEETQYELQFTDS